MFAFLVIPMLGLPNNVLELFERFTLVLVIIFVGIDTLRTLRLVEAKIAHRAKIKYGGEERQIRAAETQYSVMHRMLNVLVILATLGAALMVFDPVRAFGASLLTSAGILGLVAGVAAQRTLQNVFAGLQLRSPNRLLSATWSRSRMLSGQLRKLPSASFPSGYGKSSPLDPACYLFPRKALYQLDSNLCRIAHVVFVGPIFG